MQSAGRVVDLAAEFSAGMQRRHDDFERRFILELRMGIDRYAAAIVAHRENIVGFSSTSMRVACPGHGFVHRVVEHLGRQMVERALVGPADIHPRTAANRLEAFENLDVLRCIAFGALGRRVEKIG